MKKIIFSLLVVGCIAVHGNAQKSPFPGDDSLKVSLFDQSSGGSRSDSRLSGMSGAPSTPDISEGDSPKTEGPVADLVDLSVLNPSDRSELEALTEDEAKWKLFSFCHDRDAFKGGWFGKKRVAQRSLAFVRYLLHKYPRLFSAQDVRSGRQRTLFHAAVVEGNGPLVDLFADEFLAAGGRSGFDPNARDMDRHTLLHWAAHMEEAGCAECGVKIVQRLLTIKNMLLEAQGEDSPRKVAETFARYYPTLHRTKIVELLLKAEQQEKAALEAAKTAQATP